MCITEQAKLCISIKGEFQVILMPGMLVSVCNYLKVCVTRGTGSMFAVEVGSHFQFDSISVNVCGCHRVHTGRGLCHRSRQQQPQQGGLKENRGS